MGVHRMSSVGIPRHILVDRLHADFDARAPVAEHLTQMRRLAVVGPRLDGQPDAFGHAVLAVAHGLGDVGAGVARQRIMKIPDLHAWRSAYHRLIR